MKIEEIEVNKINPAPYNPRKDLRPGDVEFEALKRSVDEFGLVEPLVWNKRTGNLVGGHQRFKILLFRGEKKVPVCIVDLDDAKEKALNIALNKISGEWDTEKLVQVLQEIRVSGIDPTLTGFSQWEIDELLPKEADVNVGNGVVRFAEELDEAYNYVVLYFKNNTDWLNLVSLLNLDSAYSKRQNGKPWSKGVARVVDGADAIRKIQAEA